jgi:phytanoyl-CoA hydroxylase
MLKPDQTKAIHEQGFLLLEALFSKQEICTLRNAALEIVDDFDIGRHRTVFQTSDRDAGRDDYFFDSAEAVHCFLEEGALNEAGELSRPKNLAINKIGHAMHDQVSDFTSFCRQPVIGEILRDLGLHAPQLWQTMYIFKQPSIGGEVRWHQDASYLVTTPAAVTGLWVAIEDATKDNGCLWMQPGQHRSPLREIYQVDWEKREGLLTSLDSSPWAVEKAVAVEAPAGSLVLFHDHMPHYSSQNRSRLSRHAFTMHVADSGSRWSETNWLQRPTLGVFEL